MADLYLRLRALVQQVEAQSTGERLAVALVLDQTDRPRDLQHTALSAVNRIGTQWTQAAIAVQRDGWPGRR